MGGRRAVATPEDPEVGWVVRAERILALGGDASAGSRTGWEPTPTVIASAEPRPFFLPFPFPG